MIYDDVRTLRGRPGWVDIIVGSPPCQDLSAANPRAAGIDGSRSGLFFEATRLVGECRPYWGCFENVPASRTRGIDRACAALEALDYACWPLVVGADCAGAPHIRERLWLVFADPDQGRCIEQPQRDGEQVAGQQTPQRHDAGGLVANGHALGAGLALGQEQPARQERETAERAVRADDAADTSEHGRRQGRAGRSAPSGSWEPEPERALPGTARFDPDWTAGLPDLAQLDDGFASELARESAWHLDCTSKKCRVGPGRCGYGGLYRAICAAQGDAIVPQVAYQIVRAMSAMFPDARRVLDLFSGAVGGWTYACHWAGLDVVAACEIDPWRREVYSAVHRHQLQNFHENGAIGIGSHG